MSNRKKRKFKVAVALIFTIALAFAAVQRISVNLRQKRGKETAKSPEALWNARTKYVGDNSAVGKILGLLPLPKNLHHDGFELFTGEGESGIKWTLNDDNDTALGANDLEPPALLLFALVDNLEDFYVFTKDPMGGGMHLHFDRRWADEKVGKNILDFSRSPEDLESLIALILGDAKRGL